MKLGFIGLGSMGSGMARNLLRAGHELTVYNRTRAKGEALAGEGAKVASTPAEACGGEAVLSMLADDAAVEAVVFGEHGILTAATAGLIHVSMSTISTALSRRLAAAHAERGQGYVAAPVFGRPEAAAAAKLMVVAAGKPESVDRCQPALECLGQKVFNAGPEPEKANLIKVSGNFMLAAMLETFGEVFAVLRKSGVDLKLFLEIVNGNLFRSPVYEGYGKAAAEGRFEPAGFKLRLGLKDVKLALAAAEEVTAPMPLGSLLRDQFLSGVARGYGDIDWCGLARVIAEDAGLKQQ
jgi:3-hydroxyisobutyrate dehydrogenase-like beta-hydroxyacid dehydrogenase